MSSDNQTEVHTYKALPRDPSQEEHKKPRAFIHRPNENPADAPPTSVVDAAKTIQLEDFSKVHKTPCVRDALLPGIGGGMAVGAGRFVLGGSIMASCNWASGMFVGVSVIMYNYCQRRRQLEKDGIRRAVEVLDKKQALKDMQDKAREGGEKQAKGAAATSNPLTAAGIPGGGVAVAGPPGMDATTLAAGQQRQGGSRPEPVSFWNSFKFW